MNQSQPLTDSGSSGKASKEDCQGRYCFVLPIFSNQGNKWWTTQAYLSTIQAWNIDVECNIETCGGKVGFYFETRV